MYKKNIFFVLLLFIFFEQSAHAQHIAITNNLLFDVAGALSCGVEIPCSKKGSFDIYGSFRPWKRGDDKVHKHWTAQVQYRIWPCQVMNGFFFGPYMHGSQFNIGNHELCFGLLKGLKDHRYQGWLIGGGIGVGYEYALAKHWNLGAEIGAGYTYVNFQKYECEQCGTLRQDGTYNYVGISRLGLSIMYVF